MTSSSGASPSESWLAMNCDYVLKYEHSSYKSSNGVFEEIRQLIGRERITKDGRKIKEEYKDGSKLNYGSFDGNTYNHWYIKNNTVYVRIPWGKLNFTDPSTLTVLNDDSITGDITRDRLKTTKSEGILSSVLLYDINSNKKIDMLSTTKPYFWKQWDVPSYKQRLKASYYIIKDYFGKDK